MENHPFVEYDATHSATYKDSRDGRRKSTASRYKLDIRGERRPELNLKERHSTGMPDEEGRAIKQNVTGERVCDRVCGRYRYTICQEDDIYTSGVLKSPKPQRTKNSDQFVISDQSSLPLDFKVGPNTPLVWFGCTMEYMVFSNRLKVSVNKKQEFIPELDGGKWKKFTTQIYIMPGKIQQQTLKLSVPEDTDITLPRAYFRGFRVQELDNKILVVEFYTHRGRFKKNKLFFKWCIPLNVIDSFQPITAWKKLEWMIK